MIRGVRAGVERIHRPGRTVELGDWITMSDKKPQVEFVDNPNPIAKKARVEHGRDPKALLAKADQSVKKLGGEFEAIFAENVGELTKAMTDIRAGGDARVGVVKLMRSTLHDLRGQAGTFGYPLVSQVGDSACKFIDLSADITDTEVSVLSMHIDALKAISAAKMKGDGGPIGHELMSGLKQVIVKYNTANRS